MTAVGKVTKFLSVKFASTEFNNAVTAVKETPNRTEQTVTVASGEIASDTGPTQWQLQVDFMTSWAPGSLHNYLLANDGEAVVFTWVPDPDLPDVGRRATVRVVAPPADGTVGIFATSSVTMQVLDGGIETVDLTP